MPAQKLRAVLFDFHNTLVSSDEWLRLEIHTLPREVLHMLVRDCVLSDEHIAGDVLHRADALYREVREEAKESGLEVTALDGTLRVLAGLGFARLDAAAVARAVEEAEAACLPGSREIDGAGETLAALKALDLRLGVVSSAAFPGFVQWGLDRHNLARYFDVIATSAATGYYKSDPRLYAWALGQLSVSPAEAVHVGDHLRFDIAGAQRAGLRAVWYNPAGATADSATPDGVVRSLRELPGLLAGMK